MLTLDGDWISETHVHTRSVQPGRLVNESTTGFSSNRHNPGFLLCAPGATETAGGVYGFNLVYSGNHYASAQRSLQGLTRVMQGISPAQFRRAVGYLHIPSDDPALVLLQSHTTQHNTE